MDSSWLSETSSEVINYLSQTITRSGDEETAGAHASSSLRTLSKGFWITDLPTNDYEPLENSPVAKEVSVFSFLLFYDDKFIVLNHAPGYRLKEIVLHANK